MNFKEDRFKQDETDYWLLSSIFSEKPIYIRVQGGEKEREYTIISPNEDAANGGHKETRIAPVMYKFKDTINDIDEDGIDLVSTDYETVAFSRIVSAWGAEGEEYKRVPFEAIKAFRYLKEKTSVAVYFSGNEDRDETHYRYLGGYSVGKITYMDEGGITLEDEGTSLSIPYSNMISIDEIEEFVLEEDEPVKETKWEEGAD